MNKIEFLYNKDKYQGIDSSKALSHYGILGQKWGQRRWQNADGTFNEAGKERYFGPSGTTKKNKEEIGSLYTAGKKIKEIFTNNKRTNENGEEYDSRYQNEYGYLTEKGKKYLKNHPDDASKRINMNLYEESKRKDAEAAEQKRLEKEERNNKVKELLDNARLNVKAKKELQGKDISDKELENIINDIDNTSSYKNWQELEKNNRNDFNNIADLGLDAMARSSKYYSSDDDIGDDDWREWFVYEDQTIGLPQITKLYYDGYSKDYINKAIDKINGIEEEDYTNKYGEDSTAKFFVDYTNYQNQNKKFVDALFDPNYNAKDQKIGGNPKEDTKVNKEAANPKTSAKDVKINWDIDESMKPYQNAINEEAQRILTDIITRNPGGAIPSSMSVKVGPDAKFTAEFSYDEEPKIGNIYDFGFKVQRNSRGGIIDKQGRKAFADAIKRNRDMVDAQNLTDDEIDEIVNNRIKATSNEDLLAQFNVQSLRYQMEKALNMKFGGNSKEDAKANKEAVKLLADLNDKDYTKRSETLQKLYDDPRFEEQRNNVDKAIKEKFKDDFDELEKTYGGFDNVENEYLALAGLNRGLMDNGKKMEDISYMPRLYLYDDLNQGELTGEAIWAYDNGITDSWDRWEKLNKKERETRDDLINSLSSDGSYNSKVLSKLDDATKKDIVDHVYNYKSVPSSYWTLYNAGDTSKSEYDSVKDTTLKEAREISNKLSSSCGSDASGWALLNKAVNNLNLGGKDYTELTQADWDRINAEINSLKR